MRLIRWFMYSVVWPLRDFWFRQMIKVEAHNARVQGHLTADADQILRDFDQDYRRLAYDDDDDV